MVQGEMIRYIGGPHHITILGKKESGKLFVLYCNTKYFNMQINGTQTNNSPCIDNVDSKIEISIDDCFHILYIDDIKEFDLINDVVESFLEV